MIFFPAEMILSLLSKWIEASSGHPPDTQQTSSRHPADTRRTSGGHPDIQQTSIKIYSFHFLKNDRHPVVSGYPADTQWTPGRHPEDTWRTPSGHPADTARHPTDIYWKSILYSFHYFFLKNDNIQRASARHPTDIQQTPSGHLADT